MTVHNSVLTAGTQSGSSLESLLALVLPLILLSLIVIIVVIIVKKASAKRAQNQLYPVNINHCRNCGAAMSPGQTVCLTCGFEPLNGTNHCQNCGAATKPGQKICVSCGFELVEKSSGRFGSVSRTSQKDWLTTLLLCIFVGYLGVHRFYVGKVGSGIAQLFTAGGLGIWAFIDLIMIATGNFTDKDGNQITKA
jgi:TM2 domain-containing membrane protein YozV